MWKKLPKYCITIYTDGACSKGNGGWAASLQFQDTTTYIYGNEVKTTGNRMELTAVIKALEYLQETCTVKLYSDSQYVVNGIRYHMSKWVLHRWKLDNGLDVSNKDLWQHIYELSTKHLIFAYWVKGHAGNIGNEKVDSLATYIRTQSVN